MVVELPPIFGTGRNPKLFIDKQAIQKHIFVDVSVLKMQYQRIVETKKMWNGHIIPKLS